MSCRILIFALYVFDFFIQVYSFIIKACVSYLLSKDFIMCLLLYLVMCMLVGDYFYVRANVTLWIWIKFSYSYYTFSISLFGCRITDFRCSYSAFVAYTESRDTLIFRGKYVSDGIIHVPRVEQLEYPRDFLSLVLSKDTGGSVCPG